MTRPPDDQPIPTEFPEDGALSEAEFASILDTPVPSAPVESPRAVRDRLVLARAGLRLSLDEATEAVAYPAAYALADGDVADVEAYEEVVRDALDEATQAYLDVLPRVLVARDPVTGEVVRIAIDTYGLDGPWWNYEGVLRPVEARPETLFAFTGALRISQPPEHTEHLVKPGPGAPSVDPEVLGREGMQAVVRSLAVGGHLGWVVTYFCPASQRPDDLPAPNDWGADHSRTDAGWETANEDFAPRDFDLAPWIERGKLAWIAPGDESLTLRREVEGCPYLDVAGERGVQRVQFGEVWTVNPAETA